MTRVKPGQVIVHGKLSTYHNYKCRCGPCRAARSAYDREYRGRQPRDATHTVVSQYQIPRHNWGEMLPVTCWCEDELVLVPKEELLAGSTGSCGQPDCIPLSIHKRELVGS